MTADFRAGSQIGRYVLESYIGGGSFGAVWHEFMTPKPSACEAGWDALADQLAEIAETAQQQ